MRDRYNYKKVLGNYIRTIDLQLSPTKGYVILNNTNRHYLFIKNIELVCLGVSEVAASDWWNFSYER